MENLILERFRDRLIQQEADDQYAAQGLDTGWQSTEEMWTEYRSRGFCDL